MQNQFVEIPSNNQSLANRKPVYGHGVNDADYVTCSTVNGKRVMCPIYRSWTNMLERCYGEKYQERRPTYIGCTVCNEWLTFSVFKSWMVTQDWTGKELDKDIRIKGNKTYSPETCCFVTTKENTTEALAKHYSFISPSGEVVNIYNLNEFCRNNGLNQGSMSSVHLGKLKQCKGWTKSQLIGYVQGG